MKSILIYTLLPILLARLDTNSDWWMYKNITYVISYYSYFILHRNHMLYGVLLICSFCDECMLLRCLVYCVAVSAMNKALFPVCNMVSHFVLTIF